MPEVERKIATDTRELYKDTYDSPLGMIAMTSDGKALKRLWIEGQCDYVNLLSELPVKKELSVFEQTKSWLDKYFSGEKPGELPRLAPEGSTFQRRVWELLLEIPYGQTRTYSQIAEQIAAERGLAKMAAQAIGGAVGRNPIPILIPCHRVVGRDGSLVGYSGGLEKKVMLLEIENCRNREGVWKF